MGDAAELKLLQVPRGRARQKLGRKPSQGLNREEQAVPDQGEGAKKKADKTKQTGRRLTPPTTVQAKSSTPWSCRSSRQKQGRERHPEQAKQEDEATREIEVKTEPKGDGLSTSTNHMNSEERDIHTRDHHVISSEEKSSSKEEKESDSEKRQTNKPKKEPNFVILEEIPGKNQ